MQKNTKLSGGLLVHKPTGPTSHDIVARIRRLLTTHYSLPTRVGHSGTLDPFASGLLLILIGTSTRLAEYLHDLPKTYQATAHLGAVSNTDDSTGHITRAQNHQPDREEVEAVLPQFTGQITQTPPAYAAIKSAGRRLYDIARQEGSSAAAKIAQQKGRSVTIHNLTLDNYAYPELTLTITCSTGTYIRSLIRDIGTVLTTGAYTKSLHRTKIGNWNNKEAIKMESFEKNDFDWPSHLIPPAKLVAHLPQIVLNDMNVAKLQQGRKVPIAEITNKKITPAIPHALLDQNSQLIGLAHLDLTTSLLRPDKILPLP